MTPSSTSAPRGGTCRRSSRNHTGNRMGASGAEGKGGPPPRFFWCVASLARMGADTNHSARGFASRAATPEAPCRRIDRRRYATSPLRGDAEAARAASAGTCGELYDGPDDPATRARSRRRTAQRGTRFVHGLARAHRDARRRRTSARRSRSTRRSRSWRGAPASTPRLLTAAGHPGPDRARARATDRRSARRAPRSSSCSSSSSCSRSTTQRCAALLADRRPRPLRAFPDPAPTLQAPRPQRSRRARPRPQRSRAGAPRSSSSTTSSPAPCASASTARSSPKARSWRASTITNGRAGGKRWRRCSSPTPPSACRSRRS